MLQYIFFLAAVIRHLISGKMLMYFRMLYTFMYTSMIFLFSILEADKNTSRISTSFSFIIDTAIFRDDSHFKASVLRALISLKHFQNLPVLEHHKNGNLLNLLLKGRVFFQFLYSMLSEINMMPLD